MKRFVSVLSCALLFLLPELASAAVQPSSDDVERTTNEQGAARRQELKNAKYRKSPTANRGVQLVYDITPKYLRGKVSPSKN
jgi:hypothetical protein